MNKKILLLYPEFPTTYWSFKYTLSFVGKKSSFPPLGLLTVAALLPDHYTVHLHDCNVAPITEREIRGYDLVFLSAMIVQKESFERLVSMCNRAGVPVAAGGPYPTSSHDAITGVDYFIINEVETILGTFIADLENGCARHVYQSDERPDLRTAPVPRYDLVDHGKYTNMLIQYSRGCPFNCEFCDIIEMFGHKMRLKTPEQFLRELDAIHATGFRGSVFIVDDNFIGNRTEVRALLHELIRWQEQHLRPFTFFTEASINIAAEDDLMELMVAAGFDMLFIGIETPDKAALAQANKTQNMTVDLLDCVRKIQRFGLEVSGGFIVGFDTDDATIFERQISFIQEAGIPVAMVGLLTALPNTQLSRRLTAEGRMLAGSSGNNTHDLELNFVPKLDREQLLSGYRHIIREIYSPRNFFTRSLQLLKNLPARRRSNVRIAGSQIRALIHSLLRQTFSWYGPLYLWFVFRSLLLRPALFGETITLAVKGHHFFRMTRDLKQNSRFSAVMTRAEDSLRKRLARLREFNTADMEQKAARELQRTRAKVGRKYHRLSATVRENMYAAWCAFNAKCDDLMKTQHNAPGMKAY